MQHSREGLLSVHAAVLIFSFTALFSKLVSLPALEITFYRSVFACLAIAAYMAYKKQSYQLSSKRDYLIVTMLGVLMALHWVTYFHAMQVYTLAVGVISLYTYPLITVFLEPLFNVENPHVADIISSIAVLFGIYLIGPEFSMDNFTMVGVLFGVFSALMMALRNIMQRRYFSAYKASQSLFYQTLVVMLVLVVFIDTDVSNIEASQWWLLLLLGIVFTALPHTLFAHGLLHLKAKTASLIACVQVVYAAIFAAVILGEWLSWNVAAGGLIVVSAAMYESLPKKRN